MKNLALRSFLSVLLTALVVGKRLITITPTNTTLITPTGGLVVSARTPHQGNKTAAVVPNPWIETSTYGMRWITGTQPTSKASCSTSTPHAIMLASAVAFQNGDGVVVYGCGAKNTMSRPEAPQVLPASVSGPDNFTDYAAGPTGGTPYNYQVAAMDKFGGVTAASAAGTTTIGVATLGVITTKVGRLERSGNTATVSTLSANGAATGAVAFLTNSSDATFSGFFLASGTDTATQFHYLQGMDTNAGASTSATGGTVTTYSVNHLVLKADPGAYQYCIYRNGAIAGMTRPAELAWNDFGSTMSAPSAYSSCPSSPPSAPVNDYLATTISAGAGTTTLTIAGTVLNTNASSQAIFDDGVPLATAFAAAASVGGSLRITTPPNGYFYNINSHTILSAGDDMTVLQGGTINLGATLEIDNGVTWSGESGGTRCGSPQFSWGAGQCINVYSAYPGMTVGTQSSFKYINFSAQAQGLVMAITAVGNGQGFNVTFDHDSFSINGTDYMGQAIVGYGINGLNITNTLFSTYYGGYGYSLTPLVLLRNDTANVNPSGNLFCDHCTFIGRGVGLDSNPFIGADANITIEHPYAQNLRTPLVEVGSANAPYVRITGFMNDTSSTASIANWDRIGNLQATIEDTPDTSVEASGRPGLVTGNLIYGLNLKNTGSSVGQNREFFGNVANQVLDIPVYGRTYSNLLRITSPVEFPSQHTLFWPLSHPTGLTATPRSGGSMPAGTYQYQVTATGADGAESGPSEPISCTITSADVTGGIRTCNESWKPLLGALSYSVYVNGETRPATHISTNTYAHTTWTCCSGGPPTEGGSGLTTIMSNRTITPELILVSPLSGAVSTAVPVDATANGVVAVPGIGQTSSGRFAGKGTMTDGTLTVTFATPFNFAPVCTANDTSAIDSVRVQTTKTTLKVTGTSGHGTMWMCVGDPN